MLPLFRRFPLLKNAENRYPWRTIRPKIDPWRTYTPNSKSLTEALHQTVSIQITPYVNVFQTFNNPDSWQPVKTLKMSLYLPFLTRVFHPWRPETCGVIQQQFRLKECDIYGGQNMLFFRGAWNSLMANWPDRPWAHIYDRRRRRRIYFPHKNQTQRRINMYE